MKFNKEKNLPELYPFTPKTFNVAGVKRSYLDEGEGPVIVMLHGNPTWSFYYRNLVTLLSGKYRIIVPDHLGCGMSDKPQYYIYRLRNHIDNVERLLKKLKIDKYSLVVHDWGGAIGMGLALRTPERVESLVVMNTAAFLSNRIPWRINICRTPIIGDILVRGLNVFARGAIHMAVKKRMPRKVAKGYLAPYNSWANRIATLRFVQDIPLSEKDESWNLLKEIEQGLVKFRHTPMLILWGGKDFCFTTQFYDRWREEFPQAECILFTDAGHYVLEDAFDQIAPRISDFFNNNLSNQLSDG